jgi:hypothetical protein
MLVYWLSGATAADPWPCAFCPLACHQPLSVDGSNLLFLHCPAKQNMASCPTKTFRCGGPGFIIFISATTKGSCTPQSRPFHAQVPWMISYRVHSGSPGRRMRCVELQAGMWPQHVCYLLRSTVPAKTKRSSPQNCLISVCYAEERAVPDNFVAECFRFQNMITTCLHTQHNSNKNTQM